MVKSISEGVNYLKNWTFTSIASVANILLLGAWLAVDFCHSLYPLLLTNFEKLMRSKNHINLIVSVRRDWHSKCPHKYFSIRIILLQRSKSIAHVNDPCGWFRMKSFLDKGAIIYKLRERLRSAHKNICVFNTYQVLLNFLSHKFMQPSQNFISWHNSFKIEPRLFI